MTQETTQLQDGVKLNGVTVRRLFDTPKLKLLLEVALNVNLDGCMDQYGIIDFDLLCETAFDLGISKAVFKKLIDKCTKPMFADNRFWKYLKVHFNLDLQIPFITGYWTTSPIKANLIVNTGHKKYADQFGGTTTAPVTGMAFGTSSTAPAAGDTTLGAEVSRGAATITNQTTTTTGDTEQFVKTLTSGGTQTITEEGLFDNNTSGGIMVAHQVFTGIPMVLNDTLQITHGIQS